MRGGGGSTADRETSAGVVVDEHHRGIPAEPLRRYHRLRKRVLDPNERKRVEKLRDAGINE